MFVDDGRGVFFVLPDDILVVLLFEDVFVGFYSVNSALRDGYYGVTPCQGEEEYQCSNQQ
jgi:hypothetical protein